jgi:hypothetical protein
MTTGKVERAAVALLLSGMLLPADTLVMRNGSRVEGSYLGGDNRNIRFAVGDRVNTYNLNEVTALEFTGNSANNGAPPPPVSGDPVPAMPPQTTYAPPQPPVATGPAMANRGDANPVAQLPGNVGLQIPAGTEITIRLIDPVDSQTDRLGQTYRASLDQPVVVNGQTVIPRGADAVATLIDAQKSGKIQGRTSLTLDLKNVTVNGRQYDITTTGVSQESSSRGARSAKVIGGTAAVGAIIGAIAGGGRGAAIGAGSGAAAGTAAQVITSGQRVKVPAETRLSFTLQNSLSL